MATARKPVDSALPGVLRTPNPAILLILAAVVIGMAALLPVVQSSGATNTAGNIRRLEQEKADRRAEVRSLELEIAGLGSLSRIEQEATQRLKMGPPRELYYIRIDAPAPEPHRLPSRYFAPETESEESGSSVWGQLVGWIPKP